MVRIHGKCVFVGSHKGPFFVIRTFGRFVVVGNVGVVILFRTIYIIRIFGKKCVCGNFSSVSFVVRVVFMVIKIGWFFMVIKIGWFFMVIKIGFSW